MEYAEVALLIRPIAIEVRQRSYFDAVTAEIWRVHLL